jgi:poly-beta-1,6-N-acetyl-D-glucosamine biosynthesis protein PgaD
MRGPDPTIIESPELLRPQERARDTILTTIMWAVYVYCWMPLIALVAWLIGFEFAYDVMIRAGGLDDLLELLGTYVTALCVIFLIISAWSRNERRRFHEKDQRRATLIVGDEAIRDAVGIDEATFRLLRHAPSVAVGLDARGRLRAVIPSPHSTDDRSTAEAS